MGFLMNNQVKAVLQTKLGKFRLGDGSPLNDEELNQLIDLFQPEIERLELVTRIKAQVETYQRLMFWLEDQDDTEALVRLAKDIDVELVKLRAQLTQSNQKEK